MRKRNSTGNKYGLRLHAKDNSQTNRTPESLLSSLNDARIAALSFWITARSSAIVLADRTFRINCLTFKNSIQLV